MSVFPGSQKEDEQLAFDSFLTIKNVFISRDLFMVTMVAYCRCFGSYATVTVTKLSQKKWIESRGFDQPEKGC